MNLKKIKKKMVFKPKYSLNLNSKGVSISEKNEFV